MKTLTKLQLSIAAMALSFSVIASPGVQLEDAKTDITDTASLQNGAKLFMNYCSGCHAISFMRYNRIGSDPTSCLPATKWVKPSLPLCLKKVPQLGLVAHRQTCL